MISPETRAQIRRYLYAVHWKIGTIASELKVHPDAVRNAIESERFQGAQPLRGSSILISGSFDKPSNNIHGRWPRASTR